MIMKCLALLSLALVSPLTAAPNILFIMADDHAARAISCYGHGINHTPHIDRIAAEGVRLDHCYVSNSICTPSRVSFLSGQYAHNHGIYGLGGPTPRGVPRVLGQFRRHGYLSAAVGKIHCPAWWVEDDSRLAQPQILAAELARMLGAYLESAALDVRKPDTAR
jgi:arylsulfatase A-like enzyme